MKFEEKPAYNFKTSEGEWISAETLPKTKNPTAPISFVSNEKEVAFFTLVANMLESVVKTAKAEGIARRIQYAGGTLCS